MRKNLRYAFILFAICAICALILAYANSITAPVIAAHDAQAQEDALNPLANGYQIESVIALSNDKTVVGYYPLTEDKKQVGAILILKGSGYGGEFTLLGSYKLTGEILGAKMLSDSETPGLGKKSEESWYMMKFVGTGLAIPVPTSKSMLSKEDSDAVSGASVTFGGVSKALAYGSEYAKKLGGAK
ncbi:MAG: FMN-binding protein [Sphaerochaetaceae bacterium]